MSEEHVEIQRSEGRHCPQRIRSAFNRAFAVAGLFKTQIGISRSLREFRALRSFRALRKLKGFKALRRLRSFRTLRSFKGLKNFRTLRSFRTLRRLKGLKSFKTLRRLKGPFDRHLNPVRWLVETQKVGQGCQLLFGKQLTKLQPLNFSL